MAQKKKSSKFSKADAPAQEETVAQAPVVESKAHSHEALEASIATLQQQVAELTEKIAECRVACDAKLCKAESGSSSAGSLEEIYAYVWKRLRSRNSRP